MLKVNYLLDLYFYMRCGGISFPAVFVVDTQVDEGESERLLLLISKVNPCVVDAEALTCVKMWPV